MLTVIDNGTTALLSRFKLIRTRDASYKVMFQKQICYLHQRAIKKYYCLIRGLGHFVFHVYDCSRKKIDVQILGRYGEYLD
jgi:hypothetical protein